MRRLPPGGWALRGVVLLGPLVALLAGTPGGLTPPAWLVVVVGIFSLAFAVMPEHYVGSGALGIVVAWWAIEAGGAMPLSAVAAAAALLAAHLAGTLASYGPPQLPPDRAVLLLWSRRGVLLWATAPLTWLVVDAQADRATAASSWVVGMAAALVLVVLASALYPPSGDRRR